MVRGLTNKVSHILLGRHLLFNTRVQHDGYENTYTLIYNKRKKILHSIKEVLLVKKLKEEQPKHILTICQFEKESMETKIIFALMTQEVDEFKEKDKKYPTKVWNILDDFSNLWLAKLPN